MVEIIKHARYFPHSLEWTILDQKLTANGEDFAEESVIRGTLLSKILTVCAGLKKSNQQVFLHLAYKNLKK